MEAVECICPTAWGLSVCGVDYMGFWKAVQSLVDDVKMWQEPGKGREDLIICEFMKRAKGHDKRVESKED
jgi:hypothetical protein